MTTQSGAVWAWAALLPICAISNVFHHPTRPSSSSVLHSFHSRCDPAFLSLNLPPAWVLRIPSPPQAAFLSDPLHPDLQKDSLPFNPSVLHSSLHNQYHEFHLSCFSQSLTLIFAETDGLFSMLFFFTTLQYITPLTSSPWSALLLPSVIPYPP